MTCYVKYLHASFNWLKTSVLLAYIPAINRQGFTLLSHKKQALIIVSKYYADLVRSLLADFAKSLILTVTKP